MLQWTTVPQSLLGVVFSLPPKTCDEACLKRRSITLWCRMNSSKLGRSLYFIHIVQHISLLTARCCEVSTDCPIKRLQLNYLALGLRLVRWSADTILQVFVLLMSVGYRLFLVYENVTDTVPSNAGVFSSAWFTYDHAAPGLRTDSLTPAAGSPAGAWRRPPDPSASRLRPTYERLRPWSSPAAAALARTSTW